MRLILVLDVFLCSMSIRFFLGIQKLHSFKFGCLWFIDPNLKIRYSIFGSTKLTKINKVTTLITTEVEHSGGAYYFIKVKLSPSKKVGFICFNTVLSRRFLSAKVSLKTYEVTDWERNHYIQILPNISKRKGNKTMKFGQLIE